MAPATMLDTTLLGIMTLSIIRTHPSASQQQLQAARACACHNDSSIPPLGWTPLFLVPQLESITYALTQVPLGSSLRLNEHAWPHSETLIDAMWTPVGNPV